MKNLKIAVVGAKGLVGRKMIDVLHERHFDAPSLFGTAADELETPYGVLPIAALTTEALMQAKPDYALMAVDAAVSRKIAPMLAALSITVIDNSTAFRMSENVPLIIPEVNAAAVVFSNGIIANPNCTTIQLLTAVAPLHKAYGIKQMIVNTYQAVSGAGSDALKKLKSGGEVDGYTLKDNIVAKIDDFCDNGYTKEEMKIKNETAKILSENIKVSATCVRVPVKYGHAVSAYLTFSQRVSASDAIKTLASAKNVALCNVPTPQNSVGNDGVTVGRIREDGDGLWLFITADNLRKGAATNAVQIIELLEE